MIKIPSEYKWISEDSFVWTGKVDSYRPIYETLYNKSGEEVRVHTRNELFSVNIDKDSYRTHVGDYCKYFHIKEHDFGFRSGVFQWEMELYYFSTGSTESTYSFEHNLAYLNEKKNHPCVENRYRFDFKYYFQITETCVHKSGNGFDYERVVPDKIFFSYKDKSKALSLISYPASKKLKELGYETMNEGQVLDFMVKRTIDRQQYTKKLNRLKLIKSAYDY